MKLGLTRFLAIATMFFIHMGASANDWPQAVYPDSSRVTPISERMRINGMPVRLYTFSTDQPLSEVASFFRQSFGRKRIEPSVAGGVVITTVIDGFAITVQLKAQNENSTTGYLLQSRVDTQSIANKRVDVKMPIDSKLLSHIESVDNDRASSVFSLKNSHSIDTNLGYYTRLFAERGLTLNEQVKHQAELNNLGIRTLWFSGKGGDAVLTVQNLGEERMVTVNLVSGALR